MFNLLKTSKKSQARLGVLQTAHGKIQTPFFMPIATRGAVKTLRASDIKNLGAEIVLGNTYHLFFKPGLKVLQKAGGLHKFMNWPGPILTDSGGYQVFSLADHKDFGGSHKNLVKITPAGVQFNSVYDGSKHLFTPKKVLQIQATIGSDIRMVLDVCSPSKCSHEQAEKDLEITLRWAKSSQTARLETHNHVSLAKSKYLLFGIIQGALYKDLRLKSITELKKLNFDGYALGGLAVGETTEEMYGVLDYVAPELPADKPRYLMGVGYPEQIVEAVKRGIDMFDCVIPTREARHGRLYAWSNSSRLLRSSDVAARKSESLAMTVGFYKTYNIKSQKFAQDFSAINADSKIPELRTYTKAYLRHLFSVEEPLALQLSTLNNVEFYLQLMARVRQAIKNNQL
ncbi:MAG: tRNA guanosine(34) transglycosylase Tgt [Candidatus Komeilibacteria bacterium]|nr:tRNA guanosine(34) transglycosylase Tgt [Candidatus Komeilibacteria bacterium]